MKPRTVEEGTPVAVRLPFKVTDEVARFVVVGVAASVGRVALTVREYAWVLVEPSPDCTWIVKFDVPIEVGVPDMVVVLFVLEVASKRPVGSVPDATDQV